MKPWNEMTVRERDALVAEKIMNRSQEHKINECDDPYYSQCALCGETNGSTDWKLKETKCEAHPPYSTDIATAWEVIEKMIKYNPFWEQKNCIDFHLSPTSPPGWTCNFGDDTTRVYADTAPEAICLAALRAVGVLEVLKQ